MSGKSTSTMLPMDIMKLIFEYLRKDAPVMAACCLVCQEWLAIAQPLLLNEITLKTTLQVNLLLGSLRRSLWLQKYILALNISVIQRNTTYKSTGPVILKLLRRTHALKQLRLRLDYCPVEPDDLIEAVCGLKNLEKLTIEGKSPDLSDRNLWLELPETLQYLNLSSSSKALAMLLPEICMNLQKNQLRCRSTNPESTDKAQSIIASKDLQPGLRTLYLSVNVSISEGEWTHMFDSLTPLLSASLIDLDLMPNLEVSGKVLGEFVSSLHQLQWLQIRTGGPQASFFDGFESDPPLKLESLTLVYLWSNREFEGFSQFLQGLNNFLETSPLLESLTIVLDKTTKNLPTSGSNEHFFRDLISVTRISESPATKSRLRHLDLPWAHISLETLEHICCSAPLLRHLSVEIPLIEISRIGNALAGLSFLQSLYLNTNTSVDLFDGEATKLVQNTSATLTEFTLGSTDMTVDRSFCATDPRGEMGLRLKGKKVNY